MERALGPVEITDKLCQSSLKKKLFLALVFFVKEMDRNAGVEKGQFPQMANQEIRMKHQDREDLRVRFESNDCPGSLGAADRLGVRQGLTSTISLFPNLSVAVNFQAQPFRQEVNHTDTDSVKPAGDLV